MKKTSILFFVITSLIFVRCNQKTHYTIENNFLSRTLSVKNEMLSTVEINNKISKQTLVPKSSKEFKIRISKGTDKTQADIILTSKDFTVISVVDSKNLDSNFILVKLFNKSHNISIDVHYTLAENEPYIRKFLEITSKNQYCLERIDVEVIDSEGAFQPYKLNEITAQGPANWKPGLGQPLYDSVSTTFWGVEFPASTNKVIDKELNCGYLWGNNVKANQTYTSYKSICGVADDYQFIDDAFYNYIENIRIRPLRLQLQYNSWFDFYQSVNKEKFKSSIQKVHSKLVEERGVKPLSAYVIDDGWQDSKRNESDWSDKVWKLNGKFSPDFKETLHTVDSLNSTLGLWLSPGCFFGAQPMVEKLGKQGFESLELSMSMTGEKYMKKLEERILELTIQGISYFKFDGIFGHLNIRDFEINGRGTPAMPQLGIENLKANDKELNNKVYDELKTYYLVNGTERLISIFEKMAKINPDVFIAITNGAYLSPWWLQYIDVVWMINAGDAAKGGSRTNELTYRDGVYYEIWKTENTKFPMNSIFNHEPKKTETGESKDTFRDYLLMNISRGTGFIELYIKTNNLSDEDWDVLAEGLKWSYHVFPTFKNVKIHGGNPRENEVYGFSAWVENQGYISIHNPSDENEVYNLVLNRNLGVYKNQDSYYLSSPLKNQTGGFKQTYQYGDTLSVKLKSKEIVILNFDKQIIDWNR